MEWLSLIDMEGAHDNIFQSKRDGTAEWLFQERPFVEWVNSHQSTLLWCFGGRRLPQSISSCLNPFFTDRSCSGGRKICARVRHTTRDRTKSLLTKYHSSNTLEHLTRLYGMDDRTGIAYMYCRHDAPRDERSASSMVALFIKQLIWKTGALPHVVRDFCREYIRDARKPSLEKYVKILLDVSETFDQVFLVIDGLDECDEDDRQSVIQACQTFLSVSTSYRIFITSRREDDIEREFRRRKVPTIQIAAQNTNADIKAFVESEVSDLIAHKKLRLQDQARKQHIISTLVDESNGMYAKHNPEDVATG